MTKNCKLERFGRYFLAWSLFFQLCSPLLYILHVKTHHNHVTAHHVSEHYHNHAEGRVYHTHNHRGGDHHHQHDDKEQPCDICQIFISGITESFISSTHSVAQLVPIEISKQLIGQDFYLLQTRYFDYLSRAPPISV